MRPMTTLLPRRAICAVLAFVALVQAPLAAAAQTATGTRTATATATATLWSADRSFSPCRPAHVEMIVGGAAGSSDCRRATAAAAAPAAYRQARVDANTQRMRDDDRRGILLQELARERDGLARLASAPDSQANRQAIERTRTNLAALGRELARTP